RKYGTPIRPARVLAAVARLTHTRGFLADEEKFIREGWVDSEDWGALLLTFDDDTVAQITASDIVLGGIQNVLSISGSKAVVHATSRASATGPTSPPNRAAPSTSGRTCAAAGLTNERRSWTAVSRCRAAGGSGARNRRGNAGSGGGTRAVATQEHVEQDQGRDRVHHLAHHPHQGSAQVQVFERGEAPQPGDPGVVTVQRAAGEREAKSQE